MTEALARFRVARSFLFSIWVASSMLCLSMASSSAGNSRRSVDGAVSNFPLPGVVPDIFVAAAPMIVGVVCKDGVLLLALHTAFSGSSGNDDDNESILLWNEQDLQIQQNFTRTLQGKDLPKGYRGPFRIYQLDASGSTAMVCAGWRSDCQRLANMIRSIDQEEIAVFGKTLHVDGGEEYGSYLACRVSQVLAELAVSAGRRPLSCVGLMASSSTSSETSGVENGEPGCLWLVDATGAYRVRAHAVGGGATANQMNDRLVQKDWTKQDCEETARELLVMLFYEPKSEHDAINANKTIVEVPPETLVEIAAVGIQHGSQRKLNRLFSSTLFGRRVRQ